MSKSDFTDMLECLAPKDLKKALSRADQDVHGKMAEHGLKLPVDQHGELQFQHPDKPLLAAE